MTRENLLPSNWREEQKRQTRRRIARAVHELIAEQGQVSVRAVSDRSGVSPATIYRHFPNREALIGSGAYQHVDTGIDQVDGPLGLDEYRAVVHKVFAAHAADVPGVIAQHSTPAGREMRKVRLVDRQRVIRRSVEAAGIDPDSPIGRRCLALLAVIGSSRAFLEFHEMTDLSTEEAADAVVWAVRAIQRAALDDIDLESEDER